MTILLYTADPNEPNLYVDVTNLTDPIVISVPLGISNTHSTGLYFQATLNGSPTGYTSYAQNLGLLASGGSSFYIYNISREQPSLTAGEYNETITFVINAYTDSGYTNLYGTATLSVTIYFFNHTDESWTVLKHSTFDTGSLDGWNSVSENLEAGYSSGYMTSFNNVTFLSSPYSLYGPFIYNGYSNKQIFDTSTYDKVRTVFHIKETTSSSAVIIKINNILKKPYGVHLPNNLWCRLAFNVPIGASIPINFAVSAITTDHFDESFVDEIWVIAK